MTLGEKLKEARKSAGLTQEQIAEKLVVSRQAITKWEGDKGIPDIENLKAISKLLNISIDYLLDNGSDLLASVIRESVDLSKYIKNKKVQAVREKYSDAEIFHLLAKQKLNKSEKIIDNILGFIFDAPFGIPELSNDLKNMDKAYFLVNKKDKQFFVLVTNDFIESRELVKPIYDRRFEIDNMRFIRKKRVIV